VVPTKTSTGNDQYEVIKNNIVKPFNGAEKYKWRG